MSISDFRKSIVDTARSVTSEVVDGFPWLSDGAPTVVLDQTEFLRVMAHASPRYLYAEDDIFDLEQSIDEAFDEADIDIEHPATAQLVLRLKSKFQKHDQSQHLISAAFFAEGILHVCQHTADWHEQFAEALSDEVSSLTAVLEADQNDFAIQLSADVRQKADALAAHEAFDYNRAGFAKRLWLATHLWPDESAAKLNSIVDAAQRIEWLTKSGAMSQ